MSRSLQLKEDGNRLFQAGDFVGADSLYSKAILADPKNPALFTNRAMARLRLCLWDSAISDCHNCLALNPNNMKAAYYLAQAQLAIGDYDGALQSARSAHSICALTNDRSLAAVTAIVLRCKKERWEDRERKRKREGQELERELLELLGRRRDELMSAEANDIERSSIHDESSYKMVLLQQMFERARTHTDQRRQVPEWAIDDISFGVMIDPVITRTGKSYERASIMEHLRRHLTDPLTREPLMPGDLRPNLALRQACDEYLENNGWAVDW
ncbi:E3 ubiquitin-protein ligase CHIP [Tolypocladium ophioglossoides CBS 100239]|uniref:E3 ubiquitin-protein ligase CHIP n=1 Tax=Tolypocladium ophioglossoides (strain CBS 100239) TaxID=1163406 RepID=A0A0L0NCZ4_TOLOC|nr:E3 ubiquitin-protein ligase CHIP [Tolypocladium ophioglossoides CBS 100239]